MMINFLYFNWEIDPVLFKIGSFGLHYYSLMWICAFALGIWLMTKMFEKEGVDKKYLDPFFIYVFVGCLLGMRLGEFLFYDPSAFWERPLEVFLPIQYSEGSSWMGIKNYRFAGFSGLASHGATVGLIIAMLIFANRVIKKPFLWVVDRLCIVVAIGGAFVRIGNFINSEIVGKYWDGPWAVRLPKISTGYQQGYSAELLAKYDGFLPRHPSQLYEAIGYIILFFVLWYIYQKTEKRKQLGFLFGLFFICLWSIRFVVEFFKENQGTEAVAEALDVGLNNGQVLSIPFIIMGIVILLTSKNRIYNR